MKKALLAAAKIAVSAALLAYLFHRAAQNDAFAILQSQPKNWLLLGLGWLAIFAGVALTLVRWQLLMLALSLPVTWRRAFQLGFLGYLFNFFSLGTVGGDALRAILVAKGCPGRRAEAAATVVVDRLLGLLALFLVAASTLVVIDWGALRDPKAARIVEGMCGAAALFAVLGAAALSVSLAPPRWLDWATRPLTRLPKVGGSVERLVFALGVARRERRLLPTVLAISLAVHLLTTTGIFLIAHGLPGVAPSWKEHLAIVPLSILATSVPLPGGLGAVEMALEFLYEAIGPAGTYKGQGFVIALAYLMMRLSIAAVGLAYYLSSRRAVGEALHDLEASAGQNPEAERERQVSGAPSAAGCGGGVTSTLPPC